MYLPYFNKFLNQEPYLYIGEKEWSYIKDTFEKDDVKESLAKVAMTYPPPYMDISEDGCRKEFNNLKKTWVYDLLKEGEWFARAETGYSWPITYKDSQWYIKRLNTGNKSSNYFQQENRWSVDGSVSPGPLRTWNTEKFMVTLMGSAYTLKMERIDKSILRTMLGLRKYICSQFKPNAAKAMYDYFKVKNVLDFSAGWGDRLAGFYSSLNTELYVGVDPRPENHPIYEKQAEYYDRQLTFFETPKKVKFHCDAAEDLDFSQYHDTFDIIFTSPPYFNVERYGHDEKQSWMRYKRIEEWNTQFLHKAIDNIWPTLRSGGKLCVNISDVNAGSGGKKSWLKICDPMNDFIDEYSDSDYLGCIGMEMAARPNSIGAGTGVVSGETNRLPEMIKETKGKFCEPVWIWEKK